MCMKRISIQGVISNKKAIEKKRKDKEFMRLKTTIILLIRDSVRTFDRQATPGFCKYKKSRLIVLASLTPSFCYLFEI